MTFLSKADDAQQMEGLVGYDHLYDQEAPWSETWAASLGMVVDEEQSISSTLNNEGYARREQIAKQMRDDGFDFSPYTDNTGYIDYDSLARDTDYGIMTDLELYEQRNAMLAQRRSYAQDVQERGSGFAQFAGSMTGYMLDPVNVVTMPIGASAAALRGLSLMARVGRVAAVEGAVGAATELAIQPLVYAHKNEIGSPYEIEDAITAIASAAIGGAALGGAATGIAGFVRSAAGLKRVDAPDVEGARRDLLRMADDLEANPERAAVTAKVADDVKRFNGLKTETLDRRIAEMQQGEVPLEVRQELEVAEAVRNSRKGRWGKKVAAEAEEGVVSSKLQKAVDEIQHKRLVETDTEYAKKLAAERVAQSETLAKPEHYEPAVELRNADEIEAIEQADFDAFESRFADDDGVVLRDGELSSAREFMAEQDAELDGLDSVMRCAIG